MCIIEHFEEIYPDGHRQRNTHLRYCEHGSRSGPCDNTRHVVVDDIFRTLPQAPHPPPAFLEVIEPRRRTPRHSREHLREEETRGLKKFSNNLKLVLNFGNPFKMSNKKKEYTIVERGGKKHLERRYSHRRHLSPRRTPPPSPRYNDTHVVQVPEHEDYQRQDPRVVQLPPQQPYDYPVIEPREVRLSRERRRDSTSSESPPLTPLRQHRRNHSVSSSGTRHSEDMRRLRAERERLERANRNAREERDARIRAEKEAEAERRRARRFVEREQRRIGNDEGQRLETADRARRRQQREDRQALEAAAAARQQEERERQERVRNAGLTRRPRAGAIVHQRAREGIAERADRVIEEAIRADHGRRNQDSMPPRPGGGWERRRDVGGGLRRRDTVAVGQRRVYEDDRRRVGPRWI